MPDGYHTALNTFRKLLMIRAWCPDRILPQSLKYISEQMGMKYGEGIILNIEKMWEESNFRVPMICFLSMGSDPTNNIETLSKKQNLGESSLVRGMVPARSSVFCAPSLQATLFAACSSTACSEEVLWIVAFIFFQCLVQCQWDRGRKCMPGNSSLSANSRYIQRYYS